MPNGDRTPYRVGPSSPSLSHTSDSSETLDNKALYWDLTLWVARRWMCKVLLMRRLKARRMRQMAGLVAVRKGLAGPALRAVTAFFLHPAAVCFRGLPFVDKVGLGLFLTTPPSSSSDVSMNPAGFSL